MGYASFAPGRRSGHMDRRVKMGLSSFTEVVGKGRYRHTGMGWVRMVQH